MVMSNHEWDVCCGKGVICLSDLASVTRETIFVCKIGYIVKVNEPLYILPHEEETQLNHSHIL